MDHRRIEAGAIGQSLHELRRLAVRPLLKTSAVQLDDDALAVAMTRAGIAGCEPFFEDEKILAVVADRVFLRRDAITGRLARGMMLPDQYFKERTAVRGFVRFPLPEDRDVATRHRPSCAVRGKFDFAKGYYHAVAAFRCVSGGALRCTARDADVIVLQHDLAGESGERQQQEQQESHRLPRRKWAAHRAEESSKLTTKDTKIREDISGLRCKTQFRNIVTMAIRPEFCCPNPFALLRVFFVSFVP